MNYLSHLLLSGNDAEIRFGNFIGDSVKGKQYLTLPLAIQKGIILHRKIDSFTDSHPLIKQGKSLLNSEIGHYKGVVIDVLLDHFLSLKWHRYHSKSIPEFLSIFESEFEVYKSYIKPEKVVFYERFLALKFMAHYHTFEGIEITLNGLEKRIGYKAPIGSAIKDLADNYNEFETLYESFFPEVEYLCKNIIL